MTTQLEVIQRIQAIMEAQTGMGRVYDYVPESLNDDTPCCLVYPGGADCNWSDVIPFDISKSNEIAIVELLWPRAKGIAEIMAAAIPWFNTIPKAIFADATLNGDESTVGLVFVVNNIVRRYPFQRTHSTVTQAPTIDHMGIQWEVHYRLDVSLT